MKSYHFEVIGCADCPFANWASDIEGDVVQFDENGETYISGFCSVVCVSLNVVQDEDGVREIDPKPHPDCPLARNQTIVVSVECSKKSKKGEK